MFLTLISLLKYQNDPSHFTPMGYSSKGYGKTQGGQMQMERSEVEVGGKEGIFTT